MNFEQNEGSKADRPANPILLFLAAAVCVTWVIETIVIHGL
jgi:hypothetical protein